MSKEEAFKILNQIDDFDGLCNCCVFEFKNKPSCIGCREKALKIILNNYIDLQKKIDKALEYIKYKLIVVDNKNYKQLLAILGDKENE